MARTSRVLARIGVAAAIVASPVALAGPATAATDAVWNAVAECESGRDWDTDTGNGYYGGLQFSDQTWDSFGGEEYGSTADQATRGQQIEIAERVLAEQGWGAWPTCSEVAGVA
ncbi:MAG: transglycosylase family protein [Actinomycetota bacterium]|nr:transglycosylase family protein [Actinomycetota bacterium]